MITAARRRYYRHITVSVLRYYVELENGTIGGILFDPRFIDYRIDVESLMNGELDKQQVDMLMLVHRGGYTCEEAATAVGLDVKRPAQYLSAVETRLGRVFEQKNMLDLVAYLD